MPLAVLALWALHLVVALRALILVVALPALTLVVLPVAHGGLYYGLLLTELWFCDACKLPVAHRGLHYGLLTTNLRVVTPASFPLPLWGPPGPLIQHP